MAEWKPVELEFQQGRYGRKPQFPQSRQIVKAYDGLGDGKRKLAHYKAEKRKRVAAENAERERMEQQGSIPNIAMPPQAAAIPAP
jgi:hypothetical protein